jgi:hypothetical protein
MVGVVLTAIAVCVFLLQIILHPSAAGRLLWALFVVAVFYLSTGASLGLVVGILRPLARGLLGYVLIGAVAMSPVYVLASVPVAYLKGGAFELPDIELMWLGALLGVVGGASVWFQRGRKPRPPSPNA